MSRPRTKSHQHSSEHVRPAAKPVPFRCPCAVNARKCRARAKITPRSPHHRGRRTKQQKARQARRLGSQSVLPGDVGLTAKSMLNGADALPEQPASNLVIVCQRFVFSRRRTWTNRWPQPVRSRVIDPIIEHRGRRCRPRRRWGITIHARTCRCLRAVSNDRG